MPEWKWTAIDPVTKRGRSELTDEDVCFYYMTRDGRGYEASAANSLMSNFKRDPVKYQSKPNVLAYKQQAIERCSGFVIDFFASRSWIFAGQKVLLVPMPTSIPRGDPERDDRLDTLCANVAGAVPFVECRPVIDTRGRVTPSHAGGTRDRRIIRHNFQWTGKLDHDGSTVVLLDDVLTTGAHYAACRDGILAKHGEKYQIIGLFLALHTWAS